MNHPTATRDTPLDLLQMVPELPCDELTTRLHGALRLGDAGQRCLAFYLTEMEERGLYAKSGHSTTAAFAEAVLDMDRRRVMELIRVGRQLLELREIDSAFCAGELSWSKVLLLARVGTPAYEAEWLATAKAASVRELAATVRSSKPGRGPAARTKGLPEVRFTHKVVVDKVVDDMIQGAVAKLSAERGERISEAQFLRIASELVLGSRDDGSVPGRNPVDDSLYRVVLHETRSECATCAERAASLALDDEGGSIAVSKGLGEAIRCDATCTHADDDHAQRDRKTPDALRRRVRLRDGNRCRCCGSRDSLMVHHIKFLSESGKTTAWNLITLCSRCHALVHEGLLIIEGVRAEDARFVNRTGTALGVVGAVEAIPLSPPETAARSASRERAVVSLATLPEQVDGRWWTTHAHLITCRTDGALAFRAGRARPESAERLAGSAAGRPAGPNPGAFGGLIGQPQRIARLERFAAGSRARGVAAPHTLLEGPPGTGKTTLARALAARMGARCTEVVGPLLTRPLELLRLLAGLEQDDILFLDEVHAVPQNVLEVLYQAMAEQDLSLVFHDGPESRAVRLALPSFTLMAATTDPGALEPALRSRFVLRESLAHYEPDALAAIAEAAGRSAGLRITPRAARRIASVARGTPRETLRLVELVVNGVQGRGARDEDSLLDVRRSDVDELLVELGYDEQGTLPEERRYLRLLEERKEPVPLARLARMLETSVATLTRYIEPWLIRRGLVRVTARGRERARRPRLAAVVG